MKNIIALIPARSLSKSIRDKNLVKLNNKTILEWAVISCKKTKLFSKIVVSTDSKKYCNLAKNYGADIVLLRPKKISSDTSQDIEFVKHAIKKLHKLKFEFIAHIRPTTPQRKISEIKNAIKIFQNSKYNSLRSVQEMSESSFKTFKLKNKKLLPIIPSKKDLDFFNRPRQFFPKTYQPNGVIDIYRKKYVSNKNKLFGKKVMAFITEEIIEIDNIDNYNLLKKILKNQKIIKI